MGMRKVNIIDDEHFIDVADCITEAIHNLPADAVSKYDNGTYRAQPNLIRNSIQEALDNEFGHETVTFRNTYHAHNIGNNNRIEIIFHDASKNEEQMCGYLNINQGLYGECYAFVTDIDDKRCEFASRKINGCDKTSSYDVSHFRFSGFKDEHGWYNNFEIREAKRNEEVAAQSKSNHNNEKDKKSSVPLDRD